MISAVTNRSSSGHVRRILIVVLATMMLFASLAIAPTGVVADDTDTSTTTEPPAEETTTTTSVPPVEETTTTTSSVPPAEETTTTTAPPVTTTTAAPPAEETTTTTAPPVTTTTAAPPAEETTTTTAPPVTTTTAVPPAEETTTTTAPPVVYEPIPVSLAASDELLVNPPDDEPMTVSLAASDELLVNPLATPPEEDSEPTLSLLSAGSGISIEKYTEGVDADAPTGPILIIGDPVTWEYVVTNPHHPAIHGISVTDSDPTVVVSCPSDHLSNKGDSLTCTASGIVLPGQYSNTGTVTGTQKGRLVSGSDDSHYFGVEPARIVVDKVTVPSGDLQEFGFTLLGVDNPTDETFTLADGSTPYDSGRLDPGVYSVEEDDPGDPAVWQLTDVACEDLDNGIEYDDPSSLNLEAGVTITCTFTNAKTPTLNLLKTVTNDNGGTATASDWTLTAIAAPPDDARNYSELGDYAAFEPVYANTDYVLAESTIANYTPGTWSCDGGTLTGSTIRLAQGQTDVTCTIDNNDNAPRLTMVKRVINSHGGNEVAASWTLTAAGTSGGFSEHAISSGNRYWARVGPKDVTADVEYTLSESGPSGYWPTPNHWSCIVNGGSAVAGNTITLSLGDSARCEIVNYDIQPSLRLIKTVTNDDGGDKPASDWDLSAWTTRNGNFYRALNFPDGGGQWLQLSTDPSSNQPYQLSEYGPSTGYLAGDWSCDGGHLNGRWLTLDEGERVTCTINNDDIAPTLKLVKHVVNDDGLTTVPNDWTLTATASAPDPTDRNLSNLGGSGNFEAVYANTAYVLAETGGSDGYLPGSWSCDNSVAVTGSTITLTEGQTDVTCTITNDDAEATLTLVKTVVNDDGGSLGVADFPLFISGTPVTTGVPHLLLAGDYMASETNQAGYAAGAWGGDCDADGSITLARGQHATCTITNNDIAPTLKLVKTVTNDNGGTELAAAWTLKATSTSTNGDISALANQNPSADGLTGDTGIEDVHAHNEYTLSETGPANYTASDWSCTITDVGGTVGSPVTGDTITLAGGEQATCEIINDDDAPTLKLVKVVTTDDGGNKVADNWTLSATAAAPNSGRNFSNLGGSGDFETVYSNTGYVLDETSGPAGYTAGSWSCNGGTLVGSTITLAFAQQATCTITNDDIAPTLKIYVYFKNENSGTAVPHDFTMTATALKASDPSDRDYSHPGDHPTFEPVYANTLYQLDMLMPEGYLQWLGGCDGGHYETTGWGQITLDEGQTGVTCHLTATDQTTRLKLVKKVTNDNDGTARAGDWTLTATATDPTWDDKDYSHPGDHGTFEKVYATEYVLAETGGPTGYVPGTWSCDNGVTVTDSTITLPIPKDVTCTINNNDVGPTLTLVKTVVNDDGGTLDATDFPLFISGTPATSSVSYPLSAGAYTASETNQAGYTAGVWGGDCAADGTITLDPGQDATCTITNDDIAPALTLTKVVLSHHGGTATASEWKLAATGDGGITPTNGTSTFFPELAVVGPQDVKANVEYTLSETDGPAGYAATDWSCTITPAGSTTPGSSVTGDKITLSEGDDATCSINNSDVAPTLNLFKKVVGDHGGTAVPADWTLKATSTSTDGDFALPADHVLIPLTLGATGEQDVFANNVYTLSETGTTGHTASYSQEGPWSCVVTDAAGVKGPKVLGDTITLGEGESADCVVVNAHQSNQPQPELTLVKTVVNDNGGSELAAAWTLKATSTRTNRDISAPADQNTTNGGLTGDTGAQTVFANNAYTLSETGPAGYTQTGMWSCVTDGATPVPSNTITLARGAKATCTATNDDHPASLILAKTVVNDNGGDAVAGDWDLFINEGISGEFGVPGSTGGAEVTNKAGTYTLSELPSNPGGTDGYTQTSLTCDNDPGVEVASVTIGLGETITCTFVNNDHAPTLRLGKIVVNDNGGTAVAADWTLKATSTSGNGDFSLPADRGSSHDGLEGSTGEQNVFANNTYTLSEMGSTGYTQDGPWECSIFNALGVPGPKVPGNTITLGEGESGDCWVTNDDDDKTTSLILAKTVVNNNGGDAVAGDWNLFINHGISGELGVTGSTGGAEVTNKAGTYTLSEVASPPGSADGYTQTSLICDDDPGVEVTSVMIGLGETITCTFVNNDDPASLTLAKTVVNDNGGDAVAGDWTLFINDGIGGEIGVTGSTGGAQVTDQAGIYRLYEVASTPGSADGYTQTSLICDDDPGVEVISVMIGLGETITCTFVNNDVAPTLKLLKQVFNGVGGDSVAADWTLTATSTSGDGDFSLLADKNTSTHGTVGDTGNQDVYANNTYTLSESGPDGYAQHGQWECVVFDASGVEGPRVTGNTITLNEGEGGECHVINDDIAPTLKLSKAVVNDNGGDNGAADWTLTATSISTDGDFSLPANQNTSPDFLEGDTGTQDVYANNTYTLSESGPDGYTQVGSWTCVIMDATGDIGDPIPGNTITLAEGEAAECGVNNADVTPTLKLSKAVVNDNGGDSVAPDWTLTATSTSTDGDFSLPADQNTSPDSLEGDTGTQDVYANNIYTLSESGPDGYTQDGSWTCVIMDATGDIGDPIPGNTITLREGEAAECSVNNADVTPTLKLSKAVVNDNGGDSVAPDWTLTATSTSTNGDFSLPADKNTTPDGLEGDTGTQDVYANNTYTLSESGPDGYTQVGSWTCVIMDATGDIGDPVDGNTITLAEGEAAECGVINVDIAPTLKLVKKVVNDNGGTSVAADWTLKATAVAPADARNFSNAGGSGVFETVFSNTAYVLAESGGPAGYAPGTWSCDNGVTVTGSTISLDEGQTGVTCTINNNDVPAPTLRVVKTVVNNDGGTLDVADFPLFISGTPATSGTSYPFSPGTYTASETNQAGYTAGVWGGDCNADGTVTLVSGQHATCTITNNDVAPTLKLVKKVVNDNGGTSVAADWTLKATSTSLDGDFSALADRNPSMDNLTGDTGPHEVHANNVYTLSEMGTTGYSQVGMWSCVIDGAAPVLSNTITLAHGAVATCTAVNDDDAPSLILVKDVVNDNGGTAVASAWDLYINEGAAGEKSVPGSVSGLEVTDQADTYDLSETTLAGYTNTLITCDNLHDGVPPGAPVTKVTIGLGETVRCTFTNDDDAPSLLLQKTVINDNGGTGVAGDWDLSAGTNTVTGSATPVEATDQAGTYDLTESTMAGYTNTSLTCSDDPGVEVTDVTIGLGETITCVFVNDDLTVGVGIEKSTNGHDADDPTGPLVAVGDTVTWEYEVTNPGKIDLSKVVVTDSVTGVTPVYVSGDTNGDKLLDDHETWIYKATGVAVAGQYANIGKVTAIVGAPLVGSGLEVTAHSIVDAGIGDTITAEDPSHYFGSDPSIGVVKTGAFGIGSDGIAKPGDVITYTFEVTNDGNVALTGVDVTDLTLGGINVSCPKTELAVGESMTCTADYPVTQADLDAETVHNCALAAGLDPIDTSVSDEDCYDTDMELAEFGDTVWLDKNKNGKQDSGEPGINGAKVFLLDDTGTIIATATTVKGPWDGWYKFVGLAPGKYTVTLDTKSVTGALTTAGSFTVTLAGGDDYIDADFGVAEVLPVTGFNAEDLGLLALVLLAAGAVAVLFTRKRQEDT